MTFILRQVFVSRRDGEKSEPCRNRMFPYLCFVLTTQHVHKCFLCFSTLCIHAQWRQVNVILHYLSLSLMNTSSFSKSLQYYTSQSVNTSKVITSCNSIASLRASFNSLVSVCPSSCHCIKQQTLIFPLCLGGACLKLSPCTTEGFLFI